MPLILVRHTRPLGGAGVCYGRSDVPLAEDFEAATESLLGSLPRIAAVVSSPRVRCRHLAERIAADRQLVLKVDGRIAEMDFGAWEGRRWTELPRGEIDAWAADFHGARPHGGESVAMLVERVAAALAETAAGAPPVLWVTHLGVVRAARALRGQAEPWESRLGFGEWTRLPERFSGDRARSAPSRDR